MLISNSLMPTLKLLFKKVKSKNYGQIWINKGVGHYNPRNVQHKMCNKLNKETRVIIWIYKFSCHLHPSYIAWRVRGGSYIRTAIWIRNSFIYQRSSRLYHIQLYKCVCVGVRGLVLGCGWVGVYAGVDIYTCVCMYLRLCVRLCVLNMCTHV